MIRCFFVIAFLILGFLPFSANADATYWDLNTLTTQMGSYDGIRLTDKSGSVKALLTRTQVDALNKVHKGVSNQSGIYPKFLISSSPEQNAYATWSNGQGLIIITLTLLSNLKDDQDALAAIVGHEVAHLKLRHGDSSTTANVIVDLLATIAMVAIDSQFGGRQYNPYHGVHDSLLQMSGSLFKASYSRSQEIEADAEGLKYMYRSGFNTTGAIRVHQEIIPSQASFFSTHPSSQDRIENLRKVIANLNGASRMEENKIQLARNQEVSPIATNENTNMKTFSKANKDNYPDEGQVGLLLNFNAKYDYITFSSTISSELSKGMPLKIKTESGEMIDAEVSKGVDGYYSAIITGANHNALIEKGNRVLFLGSK